MKTLKALKTLKYNTRRLQAGDTFEAKDRHAVALVAMKKAEIVDRQRGRLPRPPKSLLDKVKGAALNADAGQSQSSGETAATSEASDTGNATGK